MRDLWEGCWEIQQRRLVSASSQEAVFAETLSKRSQTGPKRFLLPLAFFSGSLPLLALIGYFASREDSGNMSWILVAVLVCTIMADALVYALVFRKKGPPQRPADLGLVPGRYVVRFSNAWNRVDLLGPVPEDISPETVKAPVAACASLDEFALTEDLGPTHPFSDMGYDEDDYEAVVLSAERDEQKEPLHPGLEEPFDFVGDLEPDFRWYVTVHHPGVPERQKAVRLLFE